MQDQTNRRAVLLFGMPGSGKGTQGSALGKLPGFIHVSSGEVFRQLNRLGRRGQQVASYVSNGQLVPDELTIEIFMKHLSLLEQDNGFRPARDILVLDGIPRTYNQASLLDREIETLRIFNLVILNEDEAIDRIRRRALKENRSDDADEAVIRRRLETFTRDTTETLRFYDASVVHEIDASQPPMAVLRDLSRDLCELLVMRSSPQPEAMAGR